MYTHLTIHFSNTLKVGKKCQYTYISKTRHMSYVLVSSKPLKTQ